MAAKQDKITLSLDFNVEKGKLQELGNILNKDLTKGFSGSKASEYLNTMKTSLVDIQKLANGVYKDLSKPLVSKTQAKQLGSTLENAFKDLDRKFISLQGSVEKTFGSASNMEALSQIRALGKEIDKLVKDYKKISELQNQNKGLGNKSDIKSAIAKDTKALKELNSKDKLTKDDVALQKSLNRAIEENNAKLEQKAAILERIAAIQKSNGVSSQGELQSQIDAKISSQNELMSGSMSFEEVNTLKTVLVEVRELLKQIRTESNATGAKVSDSFDEADRKIKEARENAQTFRDVLRELGIPALTLQTLARGFKEVVSYSYEYIKNLDRALTEISVVSGKSRKEVMQLTDTFIDLSAKTGMAIDDIAQASTIFYQQGLNDEAVAKLTEYTAMFAKISGETVEVASNQITAAINGFGYAVDEAEKVIDKLSVLAAYSAADVDELATAMSKAASQAHQAGLTFDEYNAYLATMIEATREAPENIGTSMKTIMSRMQQIKEGNNTEDDVDVNQVETALKSVNISLRDTNGQLKDLDKVFAELGPKWNQLDRNTQAYLGTIIAGTRQQSRFITLMQNWDRVLELTEASENSAGAATRMHQAAMDSLDASLNNLTNSWQKLISNIANGDSFKWIIDSLTGLIKWLGKGASIAKIMSLVMLGLNTKTLMTNITLLKQNKDIKNLNVSFGNLAEAMTGNIKVTKNLKNAQSAESLKIQEVTQHIQEQNDALIDNIKLKAQSNGDAIPDIVVGEKSNINAENKENKNLDKTSKKSDKLNDKLKTGRQNVGKLIGSIQIGIQAAFTFVALMDTIADLFIDSSDELIAEADEAYTATQEEIDKYNELVSVVESSGKVYEELSRKMNKSSQEVEQLAEAADALAKAVPGALIGYDSNGNAIIDMNKAREEEKEAKENIADEASKQIANIGNLARAELRAEAEKDYMASDAGKKNKTTAGIGKAVGGIGAGVAGISLASGGATAITAALTAGAALTPIGWVALAAAAVGAIGAGIYGISQASKEAAISEEELTKAKEKANEITKKYSAEIIQNMSYITNTKLSKNTIDGVSSDDRYSLAAYIGNEWLDKKQKQIWDESFDEKGKFDKDKFEEAYKNLANEWMLVLSEIDDNKLAQTFKSIDKLASNIGNKTYDSVEEAIEDIVENDLGIDKNNKLFDTIKSAFFDAAYSGIDSSIHATMAELQSRRDAIEAEGGSTESYDKAIAAAGKMSSNELGVYSNIGVTDDVNLFNSMVSQYGSRIREALVYGTQNATGEALAILTQYRDQAYDKLDEIFGTHDYLSIDYDGLTEEQKSYYDVWVTQAKSAEAAIEDAWAKLDESFDKTWSNLYDEYEKIVERTETVRTTLNSLTSGDGIDYNQWKSFTTLLDNIPMDAFDPDQLDAYADALNRIADNLYVENGMLYANKEALGDIANLEEYLADVQLEQTRQELINKRTEVEAHKAVIDAQIATLKYEIACAEGSASASELKTEAQNAWTVASAQMNEIFNKNNAEVASAMVAYFGDAFAEIASKYNKLLTGIENGTISEQTAKDLRAEYEILAKDLNFESYDKEIKNKYNLSEMYEQLRGAEHLSSELGLQIGNINLKLATLTSGIKKTEEGTKSASKAMDEYISKLEMFLNLLRHIEREKANLGFAETLEEMQTGSKVIDRINDQLKYTVHLIGDSKEMYENYEGAASDAAADIRKGFGDLISFNSWGNYEVDQAKYNALSDEKKKLLDESLENYKELIDSRDEYYGDYLKYLKSEIDLNQKKVDAYIKAEDELVEAIKSREQKILDAKLDAIDKEIDAIEKAADARRKAREEADESEELSGLQVDLQRALMDSSGASASQILQLQKQIKDKQQEIADNSFDDMVDDMTQQLEDEKKLEQDLFDERLEEMDWYWNEVDRIMSEGTESILNTMKMYTDEFNQQSEIQQTETLKGWQNTFEQAVYLGKSTTQELQNTISNRQNEVNKLTVDEDIISEEAINTAFTGRPKTAEDTPAPTKSSGGSGKTYSSSKKTVNTKSTDTTEITEMPEPEPKPWYEEHPYRGGLKRGMTVELDKEPPYKYQRSGTATSSSLGTFQDSKIVDTNLTVTDTNDWLAHNDKLQKWMVKMHWGDGTYYVVAGDDKYAQAYEGARIFHDRGWGKSGVKYARGGMNYTTGPAWLDGTPSHPEAVLNALQTKAFLQFTNDLAALRAEGINSAGNVTIDTISFNVESMSSPEDGEKAFNAFVDRFKQIGAKQGISVLGTANRN